MITFKGLLGTGQATLLAVLLATPALASDHVLDPTVRQLRSDWERVNYLMPEEAREEGFMALVEKCDTLKQSRSDAELLTWCGIITSSYAGAHGGLGALKYAKQARSDLEKVVNSRPDVLDGAAVTSLAVLYARAPGWPIGFGDDDRARELLEQAIAINPQGIDPNYFMADFLIENGEADQARAYLDRALKAPDRPGREVADEGRREEVRALLGRLEG
jgi:tetratricopeptide (TPR) repeat protein